MTSQKPTNADILKGAKGENVQNKAGLSQMCPSDFWNLTWWSPSCSPCVSAQIFKTLSGDVPPALCHLSITWRLMQQTGRRHTPRQCYQQVAEIEPCRTHQTAGVKTSTSISGQVLQPSTLNFRRFDPSAWILSCKLVGAGRRAEAL